MSTEAWNWLVLTAGVFIAIGACAAAAAVIESWLEWRRQRNERLPPPNVRARVYRRWGVPE